MIEVVCGVVIDSKDRILITQRGDFQNKYKWEFPGGKVYKNENYNDSIKRELMEELDIIVLPKEILYEYMFENIKLLFIRCQVSEINISLNEHLDYKWVHKHELVRFDFLDGDKEFIKHFIK